MRIEEGKYYRAASGEKIGPMVRWDSEEGVEAPWSDTAGHDSRPVYRDDGTNPYGSPHLVAEWIEGPIRTETVRRLEPGVYGPLRVRYEINVPDCERPDDPPEKRIEVSLVHTALNAPELRELARVALEIAEYLENA